MKLTLEKYGFSYSNAGWFNLHSIKYGDDFITEYFPIPVLSVKGVGDIGLSLGHIFIESKEKALNLQLNEFNDYKIEIYGVSDYLKDYYQPSLEIKEYKEKTAPLQDYYKNSQAVYIKLTVNDASKTADDVNDEILNLMKQNNVL